ncbi:hypothetical protein B4129_3027 [Bacillus safensis]|nr:hypothetical protein B4129_3027 [Bacillus safensis]
MIARGLFHKVNFFISIENDEHKKRQKRRITFVLFLYSVMTVWIKVGASA